MCRCPCSSALGGSVLKGRTLDQVWQGDMQRIGPKFKGRVFGSRHESSVGLKPLVLHTYKSVQPRRTMNGWISLGEQRRGRQIFNRSIASAIASIQWKNEIKKEVTALALSQCLSSCIFSLWSLSHQAIKSASHRQPLQCLWVAV